jgi:hypothetical protein
MKPIKDYVKQLGTFATKANKVARDFNQKAIARTKRAFAFQAKHEAKTEEL